MIYMDASWQLAALLSLLSHSFRFTLFQTTAYLHCHVVALGPAAMPSTRRASFGGLRSSAEPNPRRVASCIGQPQLRSTKDAPALCASSAAATPSAMLFVAIWQCSTQ
jgi:hypothetical protein